VCLPSLVRDAIHSSVRSLVQLQNVPMVRQDHQLAAGALAPGVFALWRDHTTCVRAEQTSFNSERVQAYWRFVIAAERLCGAQRSAQSKGRC
jgi:hypothetical protein